MAELTERGSTPALSAGGDHQRSWGRGGGGWGGVRSSRLRYQDAEEAWRWQPRRSGAGSQRLVLDCWRREEQDGVSLQESCYLGEELRSSRTESRKSTEGEARSQRSPAELRLSGEPRFKGRMSKVKTQMRKPSAQFVGGGRRVSAVCEGRSFGAPRRAGG